MRLRGRCDTIRVGVVGCGLFATPNSLKSHKRQKELPHLCNTRAITPKLCLPSRPIHPSKNYLALKSRTAAKSPKRPRHHRLPLPAVSFIEGFRTPATVQAASSRSAGIRNPQQSGLLHGSIQHPIRSPPRRTRAALPALRGAQHLRRIDPSASSTAAPEVGTAQGGRYPARGGDPLL